MLAQAIFPHPHISALDFKNYLTMPTAAQMLCGNDKPMFREQFAADAHVVVGNIDTAPFAQRRRSDQRRIERPGLHLKRRCIGCTFVGCSQRTVGKRSACKKIIGKSSAYKRSADKHVAAAK